jgi:hypothetical protein
MILIFLMILIEYSKIDKWNDGSVRALFRKIMNIIIDLLIINY